jgi:cytoskeleton protein RodZ
VKVGTGLTFFQRIKTPFTESPAEEQARLQPRMRLIGELLQERREDLGLDLDEIGAMLRIKAAYLAALEQGRTHDLPGPTYAIGFVRAYAEFLGLDAEPVLARFKAEAAGITARPDLALPVPLGERSLPGGALVLVALIVALCGYGIWYYLSTEERSRPERVASVPAALQPPSSGPVLVPPPNPSAPSPAAAQSAPPPSSPQPQQQPQPSLFGAAAGPNPATAAASPAPAPATPPAPAAPVPAAVIMPAASPSSTAPVTNGAARPNGPAPSQQTAAQTSPATQPAAAASAGLAPATAAAAPPAAPTAGGGRIAIRALADCWIQVRAPDQSVVFSRVLRSGEVYNVPARSGLSLRTGNAGALEISVDGKTAPAIGGLGALRRDVALDPAELAAGTAVHG